VDIINHIIKCNLFSPWYIWKKCSIGVKKSLAH